MKGGRLPKLPAIVALLTVVLVTACATPTRPASSQVAVPVPVQDASRVASQVQVVAHPDDDLYFMAPDVNHFVSGPVVG